MTFRASFNLGSLNGSNGFAINGIDALDFAGSSVSGAGDVNGDGVDDVIIGALQGESGGNITGTSYVVFGSSTGFDAAIELSTLNGNNGFAINGIGDGDFFGWAVSGAGDVNGDGIDDVIIGAPRADPEPIPGLVFEDAGQSYVIYGSTDNFSATINLASLSSADGFAINGVLDDDEAGRAVSGVGDINNDGIDDIFVGAFRAFGEDIASGAGYVVFGTTTERIDDVNLILLDGTDGFQISGITINDFAGYSISAAGDVNGDGVDDLIISAPGADSGDTVNAGQTYVVFGSNTSFGEELNLSQLNGNNGFVINGRSAEDFSGWSVSGGGDVNGDGFDDVVLSSEDANNNTGEIYVVYGSDAGFNASLEVSQLNGNNGFVLSGLNAGDYAGRSVSIAGDINSDGIDDLIIGADEASVGGTESTGQSYVVFGSAAGFDATFDLSTLDGTNGFTIDGQEEDGFLGEFVSGAGDVNGDGIDDLIIGSLEDPNGVLGAGISYVIFGRPSGTQNSDRLRGTNDRDRIRGFAGDDLVFGRNGNDNIRGDDGDDVLRGGNGDDRLSGGDGSDRLVGNDGDDRLLGQEEQDILRGGNGDDVLRGGNGQDTLVGQAGEDNLVGGNGNDRLVGGADDDRLKGNDGNDRLKGNAGDDRLIGGDGRDVLDGGSGNDFLRGNAVGDRLIGGAGRDTFAIGRNDGRDRIQDLNINQDTIRLLGRLDVDDLSFRNRGDNTLIRAGNNRLALVVGVEAADLEANANSIFS